MGFDQRKFLRVRRGCQVSQRKGLTSGKSGKLPGKSGDLPGKSGELLGNSWIAVKFHSERTSGEVAEKLPGKFGELPGKSGHFPEARGSLTPSQRRQICLQFDLRGRKNNKLNFLWPKWPVWEPPF